MKPMLLDVAFSPVHIIVYGLIKYIPYIFVILLLLTAAVFTIIKVIKHEKKKNENKTEEGKQEQWKQ